MYFKQNLDQSGWIDGLKVWICNRLEIMNICDILGRESHYSNIPVTK